MLSRLAPRAHTLFVARSVVQCGQRGGRASLFTTNASGRVELAVPYSDKDGAKQLGARWDAEAKTWYSMSDGEHHAELLRRFPRTGDTPPPRPRVLVQEASDPTGRVYLVVPYGEREEAKGGGALWDPSAKLWWASPDSLAAKCFQHAAGNENQRALGFAQTIPEAGIQPRPRRTASTRKQEDLPL
jgi:hypothetical protein